MQYKKYRYSTTDVHLIAQEDELVGLAQSSSPAVLSAFTYDNKKVNAITNCSYFHIGNDGTWVVGRNQGDSFNQKPDDGGYQLVLVNNEWKLGEFKSWDYDNAKLGFSCAVVLIQDGKDVELCSTSIIADAKTKLTTKAPQTAVCVLDTNKVVLLVSEGRNENDTGLTGRQVRTFLKKYYTNIKYLVLCDGGGSSEMIVDGTIKSYLSDGAERKMLNGLCFYGAEEPKAFEPTIPDVKIKMPCVDAWDSQEYKPATHWALDFGWLKDYSKDGRTAILACDDGEVVFEGYYPEVIGGKTYKPIGCIIKHNWSDESDYYSIYWHLSTTVINKGDKVTKGQKIGTRGNTGYSKGVHLHFQTINLPKGMELPTSANWKQYSFNPQSTMEVYSDQAFKYMGNFDLAKHEEESADPAIDELKAKIKSLESDLEKKDQTIAELQNTLVAKENDLKIAQEKLDKIDDVIHN